jgi:hypothetical protein
MSRSHKAKKRKMSAPSQLATKKRRKTPPSEKPGNSVSVSGEKLSTDGLQAKILSTDPKLIYTRPRKDTSYQSPDVSSTDDEEADQET